ncbi:MAG TPA: UvrD-helicase domain-containing protein [Phycisphaerae bacterium]|nr:UvrD-helicase domain-containing protein [Phycisphaerae bacterium]
MSPLTAAQRRVVTPLDTNFCVTSGAGCGKTRVLVERYIYFLEQDARLPLERLAAITFTENAAAQMRERIRQACRERIDQARRDRDVVRAQTWLDRYWGVDVAPINTIHGFCASMLRRWPIEADVDPQFTIHDETEAAFLRQEVVARTIEGLLARDDARLLTVLEHFSLAEARETLETIVSEKREVLRRVAGPVMARSDEAVLGDLKKAIDRHVLDSLRGCVETTEARDAMAVLRRHAGDPGDKLEPIRREALARLERLAGARTAEIAHTAAEWIRSSINLRAGAAKLWPSADALAEVKAALKHLRDTIKESLKHLVPFDAQAERRHLALARALYQTACHAIEAYETAKRERSALDFEDLQVRTRDLLRTQTRVRDACRRRYRAILVDELQDTNLLQFEIVDLLTTGPAVRGREPPLRPGAFFGVGDPKQSIYRFRGAEVEVFERAVGRVAPEGRQGLAQSFRLHPGMAALVNHLFARFMGEAYEPIEGKHTQVNDDVGELVVVVNPQDPRGFHTQEGHTQEARLLAARLHEMVTGGTVKVWDADRKAARPARFGDVAVLLRRTGHLHLYEEAMERQGVPYYVVGGHGFYTQQEVLDVIHLLRVLDDPADALHLAGVLRSPLFAVSDEGLYRLRQRGALRVAALAPAAEDETFDPEDRRALGRAARLLPEWTAAKDRLGLAALIDRVVFESGYAAANVGRFGGARAYANLRQMAELARRFERHGLSALGDYVDYVTDFMQGEMRAEQASIEAEGGDTVRLMTIHKAKGLEFPVVALPDLGFAPRPRGAPWLIHPSTGLAVRLRDEDGEARPSGAMALARSAEAAAEVDESYRLLYVAITRAKDYLILAGHEPYSTTRGSWLDAVFDALGAQQQTGDQHIRLPAGGVMSICVQPPLKHQPSHAARRGGPRDVFAGGRVRWDRLADRGRGASRRRADETLQRASPLAHTPRRPARLTVTALATYRRCPRLYEWRHVLGVDQPGPREGGLSAQQWGTICHRALELAPGGDDTAIGAAADEALREAQVAPDGRDAIRARLVASVGGFWASPVGRRVAGARQAVREMPFVLALGETEVRGTIDLLFEGADGEWEVVDYKSSAKPHADDGPDAPYDLQLGLYALAAGRWLGRNVGRTSVYYVGSGEAQERPVSASDLAGAAAGAEEALAGITAGHFILATGASEHYNSLSKRLCARCGHHVLCHSGSMTEPIDQGMGGVP